MTPESQPPPCKQQTGIVDHLPNYYPWLNNYADDQNLILQQVRTYSFMYQFCVCMYMNGMSVYVCVYKCMRRTLSPVIANTI